MGLVHDIMRTPHAQEGIDIDEVVRYSAKKTSKQVRVSMRDEFLVRVNIRVEGHGYMSIIINIPSTCTG
jgi:hypothetical protein